jgi:hypothetical protein
MMKPVPRDDNGHPLLDRGTELFTTRITDQGTVLTDLSLPVDFKEILFHVESGTEVLHVKGTVEGSTAARLTQEGSNWLLPIVSSAGSVVAQIAAATGTSNISVFAWR